jgi:hypothetical protein
MATRLASSSIDVANLREFQRALRDVDAKMPRELRVVNLRAAKIVAEDAASTMAGQPGVAKRVASSIKAIAQQREAAVRIGRTSVRKGTAMILGSEFGGGLHRAGNPTPRGGHTTQFPAHRGSGGDAGYAVYPSIRKNRAQVIDLYGEWLEDLAREAFPD